jgi:hypothetical protein
VQQALSLAATIETKLMSCCSYTTIVPQCPSRMTAGNVHTCSSGVIIALSRQFVITHGYEKCAASFFESFRNPCSIRSTQQSMHGTPEPNTARVALRVKSVCRQNSKCHMVRSFPNLCTQRRWDRQYGIGRGPSLVSPPQRRSALRYTGVNVKLPQYSNG